MTLYSSGSTAIPSVDLTDTFNTWRTRFNSAISDGVSTGTVASQTIAGKLTLSANVTHNAIFNQNSTFNATSIAASGPVTAPVVTANTLAGTLTTAAQPNITSVGTLTGLTTTGNINLGDGDIINLGADSDLQIQHNGSHSYISDAGTGNLYVQTTAGLIIQNAGGTETMGTFTENGAVDLYYDNGVKLSTKTDGVDITGELQSDSLDVDGNADISGNLVLGGNLTVSGTTTTINTETINLADNIIVLNSNETGTPSQDGGIEIERGTSSNKSFFWDESEDYWSIGSETFNAGNITVGVLTITDNIKFNNFMREELTVIADNPAATQNFDVKASTIQYYTTNADTNFTLNVRGDGSTTLNSIMSIGESLSLTLLVTNGGTPYYLSALQIDGSSVTPKYVNGAAFSAGNASAIDVYALSILKTADATFTVLASQNEYS